MISLSATTGGVRFIFENSSYYLYGNGTIDTPVNSLLLVDDGSDAVIFKKIDGDVFVSAPVAEFGLSKSEIEAFYKENMVGSTGGGGVTSGEVETMIDASISGKADTSAVTAVNDVLTSHVGNTAIHVTAGDKLTWDGKQDALTAGTGIDITNDVISCTVTGGNNVVELTQAQYDALVDKDPDAFYIITDATAVDLTNYYTKSETSGATQISTALNAKQNTLTAGSGITIIGNVISADGGAASYQAGRGINITNDTISFNLPISAATLASDSIIGGYFGNKSMSQYGFAYGENATCGNNGSCAIALGRNVTANGQAAIALGSDCTAKNNSVAIGRYINTNMQGEIGVGIYNISSSGSSTFGDSGNTLFSVGNGTTSSARHNAFEIRQNGDIYISKNGSDIKLQDNLGGAASSAITSGDTNAVAGGAVYDQLDGLKLKKVTQAEYDALVSGGTVDSNTLYVITNVIS